MEAVEQTALAKRLEETEAKLAEEIRLREKMEGERREAVEESQKLKETNTRMKKERPPKVPKKQKMLPGQCPLGDGFLEYRSNLLGIPPALNVINVTLSTTVAMSIVYLCRPHEGFQARRLDSQKRKAANSIHICSHSWFLSQQSV